MVKDCSTCIHKEGSCYPSLTIFDKDKICGSYEPDYESNIAVLEKENKQLKSELTKKADTNHSLVEQMADLESENAELKEINEGYNRNRDKLIAMGFPTFKSCKEYSGKLTNLQKENAELKERLELLNLNANIAVRDLNDQLTKAKELLTKWVELFNPKLEGYPITPTQEQTEQFLKEIEK